MTHALESEEARVLSLSEEEAQAELDRVLTHGQEAPRTLPTITAFNDPEVGW